MMKTVLTTTAAFALMTGVAFAQAKTDGGTQRSAASPTSGNSGVSQSTGQTQPIAGGSYATQNSVGLNASSGSATGGPGSNPNGGPATMPSSTSSTSSTASASTMPSSTMPASSTMVANTPTGDAPTSYPLCSHRGQDRCKQRMASR